MIKISYIKIFIINPFIIPLEIVDIQFNHTILREH